MMSKPKISIITITYNSERTVRETFESVRKQQYDGLEYIVVDGGSTDATLDIAAEYNDIITTLVSEPDEGISDAMNKGIALASGDLIGIIHSDDALAEGALDMLARSWDGHTDVYYGNAIIMNEDGTPTHVLCAKADLSALPYGFCLVHPSSFVTRKAYAAYGVYDKSLGCAMDHDLFLRFYKKGASFKYLNASLTYFRTGGTNERYRQRTIDEVYMVSVRHGGSKWKAGLIRQKKKLADVLRPYLGKLVKNKRVQKLEQ